MSEQDAAPVEQVVSETDVQPIIDAVAEHVKGSQTIEELSKAVSEALEKDPDVASVVDKIIQESGWKFSVPIIVEAEKKSQVAEIISCASVPGFWALQIRYMNDRSQSCVRIVRVGKHPMNEDDYHLWKSNKHYVEASFSDYSGIVLVPCPEVVSI